MEHQKQDLIGEGAQYKVYDTHNGRVRKELLKPEQTRQTIISWYDHEQPPAEELTIDYQELALSGLKIVQELLARCPDLSTLFGNPVFEAKGTYTQDKVTPLSTAIAHQSFEQNKNTINAFADLILTHWQYGVSETNFNILVNYGLNSAGRLVLIDFGEMTDSKEFIIQRISQQRWLKAWSFKQMSPQLQQYYSDYLLRHLTKEAFREAWRLRV